jgi:general secretion pathway protein G
LIALIVAKIMTRPEEATRTVAKHDIATIMQALNSYRRDNGRVQLSVETEKRSRRPFT